jgi:hypothetical protein
MFWIEVEEEPASWSDLTCYLAIAVGVAVWWWNDLVTGVMASLGAATLGVALQVIWLQIRLPREARRAARVVVAWYQKRFPQEPVASVAVRAIEPDRYVISIRHEVGQPRIRRYFAIARPDLVDIVELPVAQWWPFRVKDPLPE